MLQYHLVPTEDVTVITWMLMLLNIPFLFGVPKREAVDYYWGGKQTVGVQEIFDTSKATIFVPGDAAGNNEVSTDIITVWIPSFRCSLQRFYGTQNGS